MQQGAAPENLQLLRQERDALQRERDLLMQQLDMLRSMHQTTQQQLTQAQQMLHEMQHRYDRLLEAPRPTPVVPARTRLPRTAPRSPTPQRGGTYDLEAAVRRIVALRQEGRSYEAIAAQLDAEGIQTRYGLRWQHSSVRYLFRTYGDAAMQG